MKSVRERLKRIGVLGMAVAVMANTVNMPVLAAEEQTVSVETVVAETEGEDVSGSDAVLETETEEAEEETTAVEEVETLPTPGDDVVKVTESGEIDLSTKSESFTVDTDSRLTGTADANITVTIADDVEVTLDGVTITASAGHPAIECMGTAEIILEGTNTVTGGAGCAAIQASSTTGTTLTIAGDGALTAMGGGGGAGIGSSPGGPCGNITIAGGNVSAIGGDSAAGIGTGYGGSCGDITISGGTIYADGNGQDSAAIGRGTSASSCGAITITTGIQEITTQSSSFVFLNGHVKGSSLIYKDRNDMVISEEYFTITAPNADNEITITPKATQGNEEDENDVVLEGYSVTLKGNIGVNFHMSLDNSIATAGGTYMHFTLPNNKTKDVLVTSASRTTIEGKEYYVFSCEVAAKEMTEEITAQIKLQDGTAQGEEYTYTVREYAEYMLDHAHEADETTVALVKAMLNYGAAAQTYFGYNTTNLANADYKGETIASDLSVVTAATLEGYRGSTVLYGEENADVFYGANLSLDSKPVLKLYFNEKVPGMTLENATRTKTYTSYTYENYKYVAFSDYAPNTLNAIRTVRACDGDNTLVTVQYSPLSYAYKALSSPDNVASENLKNVMRAMYLYYQASDTYDKAHPNSGE